MAQTNVHMMRKQSARKIFFSFFFQIFVKNITAVARSIYIPTCITSISLLILLFSFQFFITYSIFFNIHVLSDSLFGGGGGNSILIQIFIYKLKENDCCEKKWGGQATPPPSLMSEREIRMLMILHHV